MKNGKELGIKLDRTKKKVNDDGIVTVERLGWGIVHNDGSFENCNGVG